MKVKKCKSCGDMFAGNTEKCDDCIKRDEETQKGFAQIFAFLVIIIAGLFWFLPRYIYKKTGSTGVIIYFAVLLALGFAGYHYSSLY